MRLSSVGLGILVLALSISALTAQQTPSPRTGVPPAGGKGGQDISGPYEVVTGWPKPLHGNMPGDWSWGRTPSVWVESDDRIWVLQDGELPILEKPIGIGGIPIRPAAQAFEVLNQMPRHEHVVMVFDRHGNLVQDWPQHAALIKGPNRIRINPNDDSRAVWIITGNPSPGQRGPIDSRILKFSNDGTRILLNLAEANGVKFQGLDDIVFHSNGDFYVGDNTRVIRFSANGEFKAEFGTRGEGPGQLTDVHAMAIDERNRIYVADRVFGGTNPLVKPWSSRIQVFDENGKFLDLWPNFSLPQGLLYTTDGHLWVAEAYNNKLLQYDTKGTLLSSWGTLGWEAGKFFGPHAMSVDSEGNLYVAEVWGGRVQKFRPRPGSRKSLLVGRTLS